MDCPNCTSPSIQKHKAKFKRRHTYHCQTCQNVFHSPANNKFILWIVAVLAPLGLSPWWINKTLQTIIARPDTGESADAIVVLGRGPQYSEYRTTAAVQLWQEERAPLFFVSGVTDAPVIIDLAKDMGIPTASISGEACSRSTWENAFYTEMLMPPIETSADKPKILLVTDDLHIARATMVYRSFGFEVVPYPVKVKSSMWRRHILREFLAKLYYAKSGWLNAPTAEQYQAAQVEAKSRIPDWNCLMTEEQRERLPTLDL
ncbi:YdcF family protein [Leptolyngbyaceae cyanobacterium CCMR0082]|uniref:YdcF family protein n=1 Tax=Adonisia turfae CCMR0082 TaxID=2304604 RepID=A0A6M0S2H1_9CYAN|nr:YdcF family protein [Adonisia turfae]NEZ62637.1 YdcF family protein [Adonisia turfae CCMR0082]